MPHKEDAEDAFESVDDPQADDQWDSDHLDVDADHFDIDADHGGADEPTLEHEVANHADEEQEEDGDCRDDPQWRDGDGDGCDTYKASLEDEDVLQEHLCAGDHSPGHDQPELYCRKTCGTCHVQQWMPIGGRLRPADTDSAQPSESLSTSERPSASESQDNKPVQVHSSWTSTNAFISVNLGDNNLLGTPEGARDLELIDQPLRVLHITDSHVSTESERPLLFHRMHKVRASPDFHSKESKTHVDQLRSALSLAKDVKVDLIAIGGDLVNFPSPGSVWGVFSDLFQLPVSDRGKRIPYIYTSGNHDWMAEGDEPGDCKFDRVEGSSLSDPLTQGNESYSLDDAVSLCMGAGIWCGGVTCDEKNASCTPRGGRELQVSEEDEEYEESHVKHCKDAPYDMQREPNRLGPLRPLYSFSGFRGDSFPQGINIESIKVQPSFSASEFRGVNMVALDNSNYAFDGKQRAFLEEQLSRGLPIVLMVHIPIYVPGGPGRDVTGTPRVGDPEWGRAIDKGFKEERRPLWPEESTPDTRATVDLILSNCAPKGPIVTVLSGHEHNARASPIGPWRKAQDIPQVFGTHRWGHHGGTMQFTTLDTGHGGSRLLEIAVHTRRPKHCHEVQDSGWTYRFCIGQEVWQMRGEQKNPFYSLGKHLPEMDTVLSDGGLVSSYADGTDGRKSTVILRCSWVESHLRASEPEVMEYLIEAWIPAACNARQGSSILAVVMLVSILMFMLWRFYFRYHWRYVAKCPRRAFDHVQLVIRRQARWGMPHSHGV